MTSKLTPVTIKFTPMTCMLTLVTSRLTPVTSRLTPTTSKFTSMTNLLITFWYTDGGHILLHYILRLNTTYTSTNSTQPIDVLTVLYVEANEWLSKKGFPDKLLISQYALVSCVLSI